MRDQGRLGALEWAVAGSALPGQDVSGDYWVAADRGGTGLLGVIDGLGHGADAAVAARRAAKVLMENLAEPLDALLVLCHHALSETRGAAITLAAIDPEEESLTWLGVGNVAAMVVRAAPGGPVTVAGAPLRGGIVGFQLPSFLRPEPVKIRPGDLVIMGTDGLTAGFDEGITLGYTIVEVAQGILSRCAKGTDDALVLVTRQRNAWR
jgi:serine phosphatase RsbU (regulator of sigma subunit)